jgi:hypothetical protein
LGSTWIVMCAASAISASRRSWLRITDGAPTGRSSAPCHGTDPLVTAKLVCVDELPAKLSQ